MKLLMIGGTGLISSAVVALASQQNHEVTILNRGSASRSLLPPGVRTIQGDSNDEEGMRQLMDGQFFDTIVNFVLFTPEQAKRDVRLFKDHCHQYIFISSASAYRKPAKEWWITESTPLGNRYWQYSRDKEAAELVFLEAHRQEGFPITIVRPSSTYGKGKMPVAIHGKSGSFSVLKRMLEGKPVLVPGDGTSIWTLTWNEDFAVGFTGLFGQSQAIGQAYHITSDEALSWNSIYETIAQTLGVEAKLRHVSTEDLIKVAPEQEGPLLGDKANSVVFDNSKIKRMVPSFVMKTPFHIGADIVWKTIKRSPELQVEDPEFDRLCDHFL